MRLHLGNPLLYSTHRATLMVMVMVMGMAAPRPLYVTSPPTMVPLPPSVVLCRCMGRPAPRWAGGATTTHTRHAHSLCTATASVYIFLLPIASCCGLVFPLLQVSSPSTVGFFSPKTTVIIFFIFPSVKESQVTRFTCLRLSLFTHTRPVLSTHRLYSLFGTIATVIFHTSRNTFHIHSK